MKNTYILPAINRPTAQDASRTPCCTIFEPPHPASLNYTTKYSQTFSSPEPKTTMDALLDRARDIYEGEIVSLSPSNNHIPPTN